MTITQASTAQTRSDVGLATALRISVSRLARRLRVERTAQGTPESELWDTQLPALPRPAPGRADRDRRGPDSGAAGTPSAGPLAGQTAQGADPAGTGDATGG